MRKLARPARSRCCCSPASCPQRCAAAAPGDRLGHARDQGQGRARARRRGHDHARRPAGEPGARGDHRPAARRRRPVPGAVLGRRTTTRRSTPATATRCSRASSDGGKTLQNAEPVPVITGGPTSGVDRPRDVRAVRGGDGDGHGTIVRDDKTALTPEAVAFAALVSEDTGTLVARQVIPSTTAEPIPFAIPFDPGVIDPDGDLRRARRHRGRGEPMWSSAAGVPGDRRTARRGPVSPSRSSQAGRAHADASARAHGRRPSRRPSRPRSPRPSPRRSRRRSPRPQPTPEPTPEPTPTPKPTAAPTADRRSRRRAHGRRPRRRRPRRPRRHRRRRPTASPAPTPHRRRALSPTPSPTPTPSPSPIGQSPRPSPSPSPDTGIIRGTLTYKEDHELSPEARAVVLLVEGKGGPKEGNIITSVSIRDPGADPGRVRARLPDERGHGRRLVLPVRGDPGR